MRFHPQDIAEVLVEYCVTGVSVHAISVCYMAIVVHKSLLIDLSRYFTWNFSPFCLLFLHDFLFVSLYFRSPLHNISLFFILPMRSYSYNFEQLLLAHLFYFALSVVAFCGSISHNATNTTTNHPPLHPLLPLLLSGFYLRFGVPSTAFVSYKRLL